MLCAHNRKGSPRHDNALLCLASLTSISWTGWRRTTYHWQLPSSCYINSLRQPYRPTLTHYHSLSHQRVSFVLRLRQSFPEDCARLKLSSARASQAGLKEMMTRRRVRAVVTSNPGKRRPPALLVQRGVIRRGEITNPALMLSYRYDLFPPR